MSSPSDIIKKYGNESAAILAQLLAEAKTSGEQQMKQSIEQAEKLAMREEFRGLKHDAAIDSVNSVDSFLLGWFKVVNSHEESKLRADLKLPEKEDLEAQFIEQGLGADPFAGNDYKLIEDEAKDFDKEAEDFDTELDE
jgi:hypothetical protein